MPAPIDRATAEDLVALASDRSSTPMQVGALLRLAPGADAGRLLDLLGERIQAIPRLRQRLTPTPPGCGRPVWVDDPGFRPDRHLQAIALADHGPSDDDEPALLELAADLVTTPLDLDAPLWSATVATREADALAVVAVFHHVLADGIGGLAVLAELVDGPAPAAAPTGWPVPAPGAAALAADAWRCRWRSVRRLPTSLRRWGAALRLVRPDRLRAPRSSLNAPTGPRRRLVVARAPVERVHHAAHRRGATVNDAMLVVIAAALRRVLLLRGEDLERFVVSVPVSARAEAHADDLGNRSGVVPVEVPAVGSLEDRLAEVAAHTVVARTTDRGASAAVVGPAFRLLGRLRLLDALMEHQHLVHTFTTNLRGPDVPLELAGTAVTAVVGIALAVGNVTVAFTIVSYAGELEVTIVADEDRWADLDVLRDALQEELDELCAPP